MVCVAVLIVELLNSNSTLRLCKDFRKVVFWVLVNSRQYIKNISYSTFVLAPCWSNISALRVSIKREHHSIEKSATLEINSGLIVRMLVNCKLNMTWEFPSAPWGPQQTMPSYPGGYARRGLERRRFPCHFVRRRPRQGQPLASLTSWYH